jgi:hypothetical protein
MSKNLSPSVVQLFSMTSSISTVTSDPSDSGIESIKSSKQNYHHSNTNGNFRARGNSDIAYKKQYKHNNNNNNASNHHANNNKVIKTRASSLSPTKNMTPKYHNQHNHINTPHSPETAKKMTKMNKAQKQSTLLPPRFSMKKQVSAPTPNSSYKPTAINKSEPTFRNKKLTSTAMNRKLNTPPQNNKTNTDSNNNIKNGNLSDSGSSKSERSSKSAKSNKSEKSSTKKFCRTANFVNAGNNNNQHQRQRNNDSFCGTVFKDEMWAGSAAPPDATALPKPPTDWIKKMSLKQEEDGDVNAAVFENKKCSKNNNKASANPTTTKQPPLANSVQQMFASFNPLVSTTA